MATIRELFDKSKPIDRRIEKVITYETTDEELLKHEVQEYVATASIENHFERLLDQMEEGMSRSGNVEIGVWVSGFYGSGKSSFTKYLGFALDPTRKIAGKPFLEWLQNQFKSKALRARLATVAKKYPSAVIMLDLASEQLAGATMAEISSVLYAKVMQWAGYSRDEKIAYLEFMLERDGKLENFQHRIYELAKGQSWDEIKNQPLVTKALASKIASEFYPELFPDSKTFNEIKIEERIRENERVKHMLELIKRRSNLQNVIIILDEVGQYVAASDHLILNLDGLAKNVKGLGLGRAWIVATAQQTLTEDDPRAATNSAKLFKLKDRFPLSIDLEAKDIKEICYTRLLSKSQAGEKQLTQLFDSFGPQLRHSTELKHTQFYRASLDKEAFWKFYPFLPHHFDILLQLLSRLAKTRGGIGLRSAIKVIQDVLVDPGKIRKGAHLLANENMGKLATTVHFYDTLEKDIEKPFPYITDGVARAAKVFGEDSIHVQVAKSVAVLQILDDFPVNCENVAALMHPAVDAASLVDQVAKAVDELLKEETIPLNEVDGRLRFMSEAVNDLEKERLNVIPTPTDRRRIQNVALTELFTPPPTVKLNGTRTVTTGFRVHHGSLALTLSGDKEAIQTSIEFISESEYDRRKQERILESSQRHNKNVIFLIGHEDKEIDSIILDIHRCRDIHSKNRNKAVDKDVEEYLRSQFQRAENLHKELVHRLQKSLSTGSFIFRAKPRAVAEFDTNVLEATRRYLDEIGKEVFDRYTEAPVQVESNTAERFLQTEKLDKIASKDDPLSLVKKAGSSSVINTDHKAIISIRNYLEIHGQVDGRRLLDDFYAAPFGWSKDTTRYVIAAMLVAGVIKLRISGQDVTVRGEVALNGLRNTNSFNKIGIALRDAPIDPETLKRASDRLLELTGESVLPLEEEISRCVMRHFPDFQQEYAPLATQLENLGVEGGERAQNVQDNLSEIIKGDASDAATRLGGEDCPFFDDLRWANEVKKAFDNGIGRVVKQAKELLTEIPSLPEIGIPGRLIGETEASRNELDDYLTRRDFFKYTSEIRHRITEISHYVEKAAADLVNEQTHVLGEEVKRLQALPEWSALGTDDKNRLGADLGALKVEAEKDLRGLRQLINNQYLLTQKINRIKKDILQLAASGEDAGEIEITEVTLALPRMFHTAAELDELIQKLQELKEHLMAGSKVKIHWR